MKKFDVAVIGAGAIGSATAYYTAKLGAEVILIDKRDIAGGTSSRCDGNILVSDKMPGFDARFTKMSQDMFHSLENELDYDLEWYQKGSLIVIENEIEWAAASKYCADMVACGMPMRMLTREEVLADEPELANDVYGGIETTCDGSLNPMHLCYAFALKAEKLGSVLNLHDAVNQLQQKSGVWEITTEKNVFQAKSIVNAAGVWAPKIGAMVGLDIPIRPRQGQILVAEKTFPVARRKVFEFGYMMAKFQGADYKRNVSEIVERNGVAFVFEPTKASNFLIGSSRRFVGNNVDTEIEVMQAMAERAIRFFPIIRDIKIIRSYAGLRPYTPDHMPIVSSTSVSDFYIAAGHEGDGIGLSPLTGLTMSRLISGESTPMNIDHLSFDRFQNLKEENNR